MLTKKLQVIRRGTKGISMTVCQDKIIVRVDTLIDDAELQNLKAFAQMVAAQTGAKEVVLSRNIERTYSGDYEVVEQVGIA